MTWATLDLRRAAGDAPRSPEGMTATSQYEGPHGPVFAGYSEDRLSTCLWGPHLPDSRLDFGPDGRLDGERHGLVTPVGLQVSRRTG